MNNDKLIKVFIGVFVVQTLFMGVMAYSLFQISHDHVKVDGYIHVEDMGYLGQAVDDLREAIEEK